MKNICRVCLTLIITSTISSCGEVNSFLCDTSHPACTFITIQNTSRSVAINNVSIVRHCATSWGGGENKRIAKGGFKEFEVDPWESYDVRVLYDNGTCDYEYDVEVDYGEEEISVYRSQFTCPAPCA